MRTKGMALVVLVFLMLICSLVALVAFSLLSQGVEAGLAHVRAVQAEALARGGEEWYRRQLTEDTDWTDQTDLAAVPLGGGTFDITITGSAADQVSFLVTAHMSGHLADAVRSVSITVERTVQGGAFALFWNGGGGNSVAFDNSSGGVDVTGDVWLGKSGTIQSSSSVTGGSVYHPDTSSVNGNGVYTAVAVGAPSPSMPLIDTAWYDGLMDDWNDRIDEAATSYPAGSGDLTVTTNVDWTNQTISKRDITVQSAVITGTNFTVACRNFTLTGTAAIDENASDFVISCSRDVSLEDDSALSASSYRINCRDLLIGGTAAIDSNGFSLYLNRHFDTNGDVSIGGNGYVVTSTAGQIRLHHANNDAGTCTITPSGGPLYLLCGDTLTVNSTQNDTAVEIDSGTFLYSRNPGGNADQILIRNAAAHLSGATLIAQRRIQVQDGPLLEGCTLYVDTAANQTNNHLVASGTGTHVSGALISRGQRNPALSVTGSAQVDGIVYQYDPGRQGRTQIDEALINGAVYADAFTDDRIDPCAIHYSPALVNAYLPAGMPQGVRRQTGTWDDH